MDQEINYSEIRACVDRGELRKSEVWSAVDSAARKGDIDATFTLAYRYYRLRGNHYEKTRFWLDKAAQMGHPLAIEYLAKIDEKSREKRRQLSLDAEAGDIDAQVELGHILGANRDGLGFDLELSRHWFHHAALQGSPSAQYHLGLMLVRGEGGPADPEQGVYWLGKHGREGAEVLADLYELGSHGLPQDSERAEYWRSQLHRSQD